MAEKTCKFKKGDIITMLSRKDAGKARKKYGISSSKSDNEYFYGGTDHGGRKWEVKSIGQPIESAFSINVVLVGESTHFAMLDIEFEEYEQLSPSTTSLLNRNKFIKVTE